jgi:hypothetical protein
MSTPTDDLAGFAYGEDLDSVSQRSLGYRLLAPAPPADWSGEVEALARRLQAAPYSDHWPATDLFCSVLLADGRRLVALARYGLADHTPGQRRGGLELIGVVAATGLDVRTALALYRWLRQRRDAADDLHALGGRAALAEVLKAEPPQPPPADPVPVLPVRLWQEGALLFAASTPSDPDHHLRLLEQASGSSWQWLPLVGADFPLPTYAQRGPLIAWTPHLAGVALKLDRKSPEPAPHRPARPSRLAKVVRFALLLLLLGLLGANLWSTLELHRRLGASASAPTPPEREQAPPGPKVEAPASGGDARQRFAEALAELLTEQGGRREWDGVQEKLLSRYERLAREGKTSRLPDGDVKGRVAVAALSVLSERGGDRIEKLVRKALAGKGFDDRLVNAACEMIQEQLRAEERP